MIETRGLTKQFGDFTAVDGIDLSVHEGEVLALLGPNGAGKTTTVRMLASILKPTAGWARVAGYDTVQDARMVRHRPVTRALPRATSGTQRVPSQAV
jgi:ABC-type multidrug transport system ATPase subunit